MNNLVLLVVAECSGRDVVIKDFNWIWQTILIFYVGRFVLRLAGRKSISQMTITQVVVMVGIGSLLIQPVAGDNLWVTFGVAVLITILMIVTEYLEMKFDILETISTGKAKIVIENGTLVIDNLRKLRMSVDRLETRIRQSGISSIDDVKYATIEVSGLLGYELKDNKKPLTKDDIIPLMKEIAELKMAVSALAIVNKTQNPEQAQAQTQAQTQDQTQAQNRNNLFEEIKSKKNEGKNEP